MLRFLNFGTRLKGLMREDRVQPRASTDAGIEAFGLKQHHARSPSYQSLNSMPASLRNSFYSTRAVELMS